MISADCTRAEPARSSTKAPGGCVGNRTSKPRRQALYALLDPRRKRALIRPPEHENYAREIQARDHERKVGCTPRRDITAWHSRSHREEIANMRDSREHQYFGGGRGGRK